MIQYIETWEIEEVEVIPQIKLGICGLFEVELRAPLPSLRQLKRIVDVRIGMVKASVCCISLSNCLQYCLKAIGEDA